MVLNDSYMQARSQILFWLRNLLWIKPTPCLWVMKAVRVGQSSTLVFEMKGWWTWAILSLWASFWSWVRQRCHVCTKAKRLWLLLPQLAYWGNILCLIRESGGSQGISQQAHDSSSNDLSLLLDKSSDYSYAKWCSNHCNSKLSRYQILLL